MLIVSSALIIIVLEAVNGATLVGSFPEARKPLVRSNEHDFQHGSLFVSELAQQQKHFNDNMEMFLSKSVSSKSKETKTQEEFYDSFEEFPLAKTENQEEFHDAMEELSSVNPPSINSKETQEEGQRYLKDKMLSSVIDSMNSQELSEKGQKTFNFAVKQGYGVSAQKLLAHVDPTENGNHALNVAAEAGHHQLVRQLLLDQRVLNHDTSKAEKLGGADVQRLIRDAKKNKKSIASIRDIIPSANTRNQLVSEPIAHAATANIKMPSSAIPDRPKLSDESMATVRQAFDDVHINLDQLLTRIVTNGDANGKLQKDKALLSIIDSLEAQEVSEHAVQLFDFAVSKGYTMSAELLLKDVDPSKNGNAALSIAATNNDKELVELLLRDQRVLKKDTITAQTANGGKFDELIKNAQFKGKVTKKATRLQIQKLYWAIEAKDTLEIEKLILDLQMDSKIPGDMPESVYQQLIRDSHNGNYAIALKILDKVLQNYDSEGIYELSIAVKNNDLISAARYLSETSGNSEWIYGILIDCIRQGKQGLFENLLAEMKLELKRNKPTTWFEYFFGTEMTPDEKFLDEALGEAAAKGDLENVELLMGKPYEANPAANNNYAFLKACENNHLKVVNLLLNDEQEFFHPNCASSKAA